jgi:dethiobiotin synthetase
VAEVGARAPVLLVTGTDTGVGKTWVSVGLLKALGRAGVRARGLKAVASGAEPTPEGLRHEDALALMAAASAPTLPYAAINPYCYAPPIAPHLAAEAAGRPVDPAILEAAVEHARRDCELLLVEGAGGWRVPLAAGYGFRELARAVGADVLLVIGLRLGCINHARLSAEAIQRDGLNLRGWIGNTIEPAMPARPGNLATLQALLSAPCLGVLPAGPDDAAFDALAATLCADLDPARARR